MLLSQYLTVTRSLIQTPQSPIPLITDALLTLYINIARGQIAAQGECVEALGQLTVGPDAQQYLFSAIDFAPQIGFAGALNIRMMTWGVASGQKRMAAREWPWFNNYELAQPVPAAGTPRVWAQYGQGAGGSVFVNLVDGYYALRVDAAGWPSDLVDDTTIDLIPYLWTDAVPFYAAYYAYMAMQRQADADMMLKRFGELMARARSGATPAVQPGSFAQGPDPMGPNRLGIHPAAQRGAATAA